jgi:hypothetical protein
MKPRIPSPALVLSAIALLVAVGGGAAIAAGWSGSKQQVKQLIGQSVTTSGGDHFFRIGHTQMLGKIGHFTFTATCSNPSKKPGAQQVTFDVTADTTTDLDGTGPKPAGTKVNIHTDSDAPNSTSDAPLNAGDFTQVGGASSSTEIAADGEEVDVFYNDGVNWPAGNGSKAHNCFAGYTGVLGFGFHS